MELSDSDICYLNVGGERMCCSRSTLRSVKNSSLDKMFSSPWYDQMAQDQTNRDGNIFLNWDPALFKIVIRYLWSLQFTPSAHPPLLDLHGQQLKDFRAFVKYLLLDEHFFPRHLRYIFDPEWTHATYQLGGDRRTARRPAETNSYCAAGTGVVPSDCAACWTIQVSATCRPGTPLRWIGIGVIDTGLCSAIPTDPYQSGVHMKMLDMSTDLQCTSGDVFSVSLDAAENSVSLCLERTMCLQRVDKWQLPVSASEWRLCVMTNQSVTFTLL